MVAAFRTAVYLEVPPDGVTVSEETRHQRPGCSDTDDAVRPVSEGTHARRHGHSDGGAEDDEPRVVAVVTPDAVRLPVAIVAAGPHPLPLTQAPAGATATIGDGQLSVGELRLHAARWWTPVPRVGSLSGDLACPLPQRLARLRDLLTRARTGPGLAGHEAAENLVAGCASGDVHRASDAAERLVGLGPGLTPSGDDMIAGAMLSSRLFGEALPGGAPAVALADSLAAVVTRDTYTRTTAVSATLLRCAARGEAAAQVGAVLSALGGGQGLAPASARLLSVGHTSGADLTWGLLAGADAALHAAGV